MNFIQVYRNEKFEEEYKIYIRTDMISTFEVRYDAIKNIYMVLASTTMDYSKDIIRFPVTKHQTKEEADDQLLKIIQSICR